MINAFMQGFDLENIGGILLSQFETASTAETFRMFKSQVSLP